MALKFEIGQRFERLVVLSRAGIDNQGSRTWLCRCDCGREKTVSANRLKSSKSCGCIRNEFRSIKIGEKYNQLTVIEFVRRGGTFGVPYFKFKCDCGNFATLNGYRVSNGLTKSCGCLRKKRLFEVGLKRKLPFQEAAARALFCRYRNRARDRGILFNLEESIFKELVSKPCTYCGKFRQMNLKSYLQRVQTLSGLDRVNSSAGYTNGNVVPSCCRCNVAKASMSDTEFFQWIKDVYTHTCA